MDRLEGVPERDQAVADLQDAEGNEAILMNGPSATKSDKHTPAAPAYGGRAQRHRPAPATAEAEILRLQQIAGNQAVSQALAEYDEGHAGASEMVQSGAPGVGEGLPLDPATRSYMEARFGADLSGVRVHTDGAAAQAAARVQANAYTVGQDVVFGAGRYALNTAEGQRLLAHELAHAVQQRDATPTSSPAIGPQNSVVESEAATAAARIAGGSDAGDLSASTTMSVQRESANPVAEGLDAIFSMAPSGGPGADLFVATLRGFVVEMTSQIVDQKKGEAAIERLKELKSPKNIGLLFVGYVGGVVAGVLSPLTGLFDLAVFGEKLGDLIQQLAANVLKGGSGLIARAKALGASIVGFGKTVANKIKELRDNPSKTFSDLLTAITAAAIQKANEAGHAAARKIIQSFESYFAPKPTESLFDILTKPKEGESLSMPLGTLNSKLERLKEKGLSTPWTAIGYDIGYIVGAVAVNIALIATTGGIGNAIAEIGTALGRLAPVLARAAEAITAIGRAIAAVEEGITLLTRAVAKPLEPLLKELTPILEELRAFLRELLGLAKEEVGTAAGASAKAVASELRTPPVSGHEIPGPGGKPQLRSIPGEGQAVSPPQGKVRLAASRGEIVPPSSAEPRGATAPTPAAKPEANAPGAMRPTEGPTVRGVPGTGRSVSQPQGKLRLAASEGKTIPPPAPPTEPQVAAASAVAEEEDVLAATGTGGNKRLVGTSRPRTQPTAVAQQEPARASAGSGGKQPLVGSSQVTTTQPPNNFSGEGGGASPGPSHPVSEPPEHTTSSESKTPKASVAAAENGPYKDIEDRSLLKPGREFSGPQKSKILDANRSRNGGRLKSDDPLDPYQDLSEPTKSISPGMGGQPQDPAMAAVDHIVPRSSGGSNSYGNARVISQYYNNLLRAKGNPKK